MQRQAARTPVAIVGMACRLPQANNLDEFWRLLVEGRSAVTEMPAERLDRELHYAPEKGVFCKTYTSLGCLVDYQPVDPSRVPLSQEEIDNSDVALTTMADVAAEACRHAGYDPFHMPDSFHRAGVYIGHVNGSDLGSDLTYSSLIEQTAQFVRDIEEIDDIVGGEPSHLIRDLIESVRRETKHRSRDYNPDLNAVQCAALISKMLKFDGPFMVINAACASSLQAIGSGVRQIQLGHVDAALVGGASYCRSASLVMFSQAQSVSPTGTRPFDANADGLINGEGYVAFLLKSLDKAIADGDQIQAVIRSIGFSCDGRGKSLWAPKKEGQIAAMQRAYGDGLDVTKLQYIEAHATSTQVGDQTEVQSLAEALRGRLPAGVKLPIGSVKGNIGHTIETAGAAGVLKTILAMQNGVIPPTANTKQLNPSIDWEQIPLWVPQQAIEWPNPKDGHSRRAAVNSFGIGGLNVHMILDEEPTPQERKQPPRPSTALTVRGRRPDFEPIAIVGFGGVFPGARTIEAFLDMVQAGSDPKTDLPKERWDAEIPTDCRARDVERVPSILAGFITDFEYDWRTHKVPPKQVFAADPQQFMLLDAVDQAMKNAGYDKQEFDRERTGVCVGAITSGEFHEHLQMGLRLPEFGRTLASALGKRGATETQIQRAVEQYTEVLLKRMPAITDETGSYTSSTLVSRITKTWNLMGGGTAVHAGGASGAAALATCIDQLHTGDCNLMICAAGQRSMGFCIHQYYQLCDHLANPRDASAGGLTTGEGVSVVLLKRLCDAERDGDKVQGIIRGIAASSNVDFKQAVVDAVQRGQQQADIAPDDVSYVEAAAAGLIDDDRQELAALERTFNTGKRSTPLHVGGLSGQIGFLGSGATTAAILKTTQTLNSVEAFANVKMDQLAALAAQYKDTLRIADQREPLPAVTDDGRLFAGVNATYLGQLAYHVVMQRPENVPAVKTPSALSSFKVGVGLGSTNPNSQDGRGTRSTQPQMQTKPDLESQIQPFHIVRLSADTVEQLVDRINEAQQIVAQVFAQSPQTAFAAAQQIRLAIVCENESELAEKLQLAARMIQKPNARTLLEEKGIFCREPFEHPRVVMCFSGQGSQYTGMLQPLTEAFAPAGVALDQIEQTLARLHYPRFRDVAWQNGEKLGLDVWQTQLALLCADSIVYHSLCAMGVDADCVTGHSFGEYPALVAAGALDFENAVRTARARCLVIEDTPTAKGVMLSIAAEPRVLSRYCADWARTITVACRNAADQFVVGGDEPSVCKLGEWLKKEGIQSRLLQVPRAFHTPLMGAVKQPFAQVLREIDVQPPRLPILSSVTNRYVADPGDIRKNLVNQLTDPVNYIELIERLCQDGVNIFVESGPNQILTKLHRRILGQRDVVIIGFDVPKRNAVRQLANLRACLDCAGVFDRERVSSIFGQTTKIAAKPVDRPAVKETAASQAARDDCAETAREIVSSGLRLIRLTGSPFEMGLQHGREHASSIRKLVRRYADLAGARTGQLPDLSNEIDDINVFFGEPEIEEMRGVASGAGVCLESVVAHNLALYPDSGAGCVHFGLTVAANPSVGMLHAANEDQPLALSVRECLTRCVQLRRPSGRIPHVVFGVVGQLGGINGMNASGLAVTSAMLLDAPRQPGHRRGLAHAAIVNRILAQATDVDTAVEIAREHCGASGWSMCISSHQTDELTYFEYDGRSVKVRPHQFKVLAANHCMLHQGTVALPAHSQARLARLEHLFGNGQLINVTVEQAKQALRDRYDVARGRETKFPTMNTVRRVDNQASIVMQPATGKVWIADRPSGVAADDFVELDVNALFHARSETGTEAESTADSQPACGEQPTTKLSGLAAKILTGEAARRSLADNGIGPDVKSDSVCYRYTLRLVESALPDVARSIVDGRSLIIGDNQVARSLQQQIGALGAHVSLMPGGDDIDTVVAKLDDLWNDGPILNVFVVTAHDQDTRTELNEAEWNRRRMRGVQVPFFLLQRWVQLLVKNDLLDRAAVIAATRLGGDFGLSGQIAAVESGGLTGLIKSMANELGMKTNGQFTAKIVDFCEGHPATVIATRIRDEFTCAAGDVEVGWVGEQRFIVRPVAETVDTCSASSAATPRGAWVITGGARGVTAVVARELGKRYPLKLHLIGSSPLPATDPAWRDLSAEQKRQLRSRVMKEAVAEKKVPAVAWSQVEKSIEIDRNLRQLDADGVSYEYHVCDITDRQALHKVLVEVRRQDGPICGVVHGAGFESALRFEKKKRDLVQKTLQVKVDGAASLMSLTTSDPIQYFLAFGSISGRFGGIGQTDYATANDMLSKLVSWYRNQRPDCHAVTFHWHAWDEVGMAVRPESSHLRDIGNVTYMPTCEGVNHLLNELAINVPENEVVITGWPFHKLASNNTAKAGKPSGRSTSATTKTAPEPQLTQALSEKAVITANGFPTAEPIDLPLIDGIADYRAGEKVVCEIEMDPVHDPFLTHHLYRGRPLTPGVIALAAVAQTAQQFVGDNGHVTGLRNVELIEPLRFHADDKQIIRIHGTAFGNLLKCEVTSDLVNRNGKLVKKDRVYQRATAELSNHPEPVRIASPLTVSHLTWHEFSYPDDFIIWNGPALRALQQVAASGPFAWGRIASLDPEMLRGQRGRNWLLPCAAIDAVFTLCGIQVFTHIPSVATIPNSIEQLRWGRMPMIGEPLIARVCCNEMDSEQANFDFLIFGENNEVLVHATGYRGVFAPSGLPVDEDHRIGATD